MKTRKIKSGYQTRNQLGRSDTTTTLRYYAHLVPNKDSSRVESFENSILGTNYQRYTKRIILGDLLGDPKR